MAVAGIKPIYSANISFYTKSRRWQLGILGWGLDPCTECTSWNCCLNQVAVYSSIQRFSCAQFSNDHAPIAQARPWYLCQVCACGWMGRIVRGYVAVSNRRVLMRHGRALQN